ncbi:MAG: transglycosylase SLT domain-containing protein, partial [Caulobacteraceae bacterium]
LTLAKSSGDAWIAGLSAYRLGQYADAMVSFETLAANPAEADATRAAGAYWAAKAAEASGAPKRATPLLKIAAAEPDTFYGMIAKRALELADDPVGRLIEAADKGALPGPASQGEDALARLIRTDPHARRAVALTQLGRTIDAGAELRTGFSQAPDAAGRAVWMGLMVALNPNAQSQAAPALASAIPTGHTIYPTPTLQPTGGFTVDKALVYAVVWQESRFDNLAVSRVGAVGLMQLMPPSAANMAGDVSLTSDPSSLFDAGKNLELGQAYLAWLEANAGGYDILRTVAAYNGGPATLARTEALVGPDAGSLMVVESMPAAETRAYVKKVMAAYWSYRRQFGAPTRTLDAVASGMRRIDARLDSPASAPAIENAEAAPDPASSAQAREALDILLRQSG